MIRTWCLKSQQMAAKDLSVALAAGALTGLVGLLSFGVVHAILISPIWGSLPGGAPFALLAGLAIGWAFYEMYPQDRQAPRLRNGIRLGALLWLSLLPMTAFALWLRVSGRRASFGEVEIVIELVLAVATGAVIGWLTNRNWRATGAFGAAVLGIVLAMGGPIPVLHDARAMKLFIAFLPIYVISGMALAYAQRRLNKGGRNQAEDDFALSQGEN